MVGYQLDSADTTSDWSGERPKHKKKIKWELTDNSWGNSF